MIIGRALVKVSFCLHVVAGAAQAQRAERPPAPRRYVQESVSTRSGLLTLTRVEDDWIGETNWAVGINRKGFYRTQDDVFGSVAFHSIFKSGLGAEIVLLQETFVRGGCAQFRVIKLEGKSRATITDRFGTCDPKPTITLQGDKLTFDFAPKEPTATDPERWVFQGGKLSRQTAAPQH